MVYDAARGQVVLFGGSDAIGRRLNDTWVWDGTTWLQKSPPNSPTARYEHEMVYDAARGEVVLFGGSDASGIRNDTWIWDGATWTQKSPPNSPAGRAGHRMAYDAARAEVVLFGGADGISPSPGNETWVWDGATWTQKSPPSSPGGRSAFAMTYDAARGQVVLFGGASVVFLRDTFVWNGTTWTSQSPANAPTGRTDHKMAYDAGRGQVLLFGGFDATGLRDDTWVWDGTTWTQKSPPNSPTARFAHDMAYDVGRGEVVLFGGAGSSGLLNDTWLWPGDSASSTGTILVTTNLPAGSFTITGPANYIGSGTSFSQTNAPAGTYTITFGSVPGYSTPISQRLVLTDGATISFDGTYQPFLLISPSTLLFKYAPGANASAAPQQLSIASSGSPLPFTISFVTSPPGGTWLSLSQSAGTATSTGVNIVVSASPNMPTGSYFATAAISASNASNPVINIPVSLIVSAIPIGPPTLAQKATLTVVTNTSILLNKASFTIFDAAGHTLPGAIDVTSYGPTGVRPGPYSIKYNPLPGYYTPRTETVTLKAGDTVRLSAKYRRLILISFTGFSEAPYSSPGLANCLAYRSSFGLLGSTGAGVQYPSSTWSSSSPGMISLLYEIEQSSDVLSIALSPGVNMAGFTFYSTTNVADNACTPGSDSIHFEAIKWFNTQTVTHDDYIAVIGHSYGGNAARRFVDDLHKAGYIVNYLATVDPIDWNTCDVALEIDAYLANIFNPTNLCDQSHTPSGQPLVYPDIASAAQSFLQTIGAPSLGVTFPFPKGYSISPALIVTRPAPINHFTIATDPFVHSAIKTSLVNLVTPP